MLVGVDIGTTHCKAGLFDKQGSLIALAYCATPTRQVAPGYVVYDPDQLWMAVAAIIQEVAAQAASRIAAIGIASMAETGVLIDRSTGKPRTSVIPWFDRSAAPLADRIAHAADRFERFRVTGQYPTFKSGLAKLLHLREQGARVEGAVWLSAADYLAYRLTGELATDYSLAARSYAFRLDRQCWDTDWLDDWGLPSELLPPVLPSGTSLGHVLTEHAAEVGLSPDTAVAIGGHDHVCAAFGVGAVDGATVFDSMGTAETLIGGLAARPLGRDEYKTGLTYGCHVVPGWLYWMGGLSSSGGSVEWLRALLGDPPLTYSTFEALVDGAGPDPTGLLYFPYLLGSGTPHPDQQVKAAFIGLGANHTRAHLAKAVLEGIAYELEFIRRAAERGTGGAIDTVVAAGGGTRNQYSMQIKANVGGHRVLVAPQAEATVLGAALLAGIGCNVYEGVGDALRHVRSQAGAVYTPDAQQHKQYRRIYEQGYEAWQQPLRQIARNLAEEGTLAT